MLGHGDDRWERLRACEKHKGKMVRDTLVGLYGLRAARRSGWRFIDLWRWGNII